MDHQLASSPSSLRLVLVLVIALPAAGCFRRPVVPPTTPLLAESPAALHAGEEAVSATASFQSPVFGPAVLGGQAGYRFALRERLELSFDGAVTVIAGESDLANTPHRAAYTGRAGIKYQPLRNFALTGGLGGGIAPAYGGLLGADVGFVTGYENPYLVPFLAVRGGVGVPIDPRAVDVSTHEEGAGTVVLEPATTLYGGPMLGLRIPMGPDRGGTLGRPGDLTLSGGFTCLYDGRSTPASEDSEPGVCAYSFGAGFAFRFGADPEPLIASGGARRGAPAEAGLR
jgi:hypothetical protein